MRIIEMSAHNTAKVIFAACAAAFMIQCASAPDTAEAMKKSDLSGADAVVAQVEKNNGSLPDSFISRITVKSSINGRSFKSSGTAWFASKPQSIKVQLSDLIFKTPLAEILLQEDQLRIYLPIEKTVYIRSASADGSEASLEVNPFFMSRTALGRVPLISGYRITRFYQGESAGSKVIVLENDMYYESIALKDGIPGKVKILSKSGTDTYEVHYSDPVISGGSVFFRKIYAFSESSGNSLEIEYTDLNIGAAIDRDKIFRIDIPRGTKILH